MSNSLYFNRAKNELKFTKTQKLSDFSFFIDDVFRIDFSTHSHFEMFQLINTLIAIEGEGSNDKNRKQHENCFITDARFEITNFNKLKDERKYEVLNQFLKNAELYNINYSITS